MNLKGNNVIRPYASDDLDGLLTVWDESTRIAHPFFTEEFLLAERRNIPELYLPNAETWVWENDETIVAFLALIGNEIGAIFVAPQQQRRGIGRALVDYARSIRESLEVEVFEDNALGRAFYDSYGFQLLSQRVHEETGHGLLRLRLGE